MSKAQTLKEQRLSLIKTLLPILALPITLILAINVYWLVQNVNQLRNATLIEELTAVAANLSSLVHESQKERGLSTGFLGSAGKKFQHELSRQYSAFDEQERLLDSIISSKEYQEDLPPKFRRSIEQILKSFGKKDFIRSRVQSLDISRADVMSYYSQLNLRSINLIQSVLEYTDNTKFTRQISSYANFLHSKELAGRERALLTHVFANDGMALADLRLLIELIQSQEIFFDVFQGFANSEQIQWLDQALNTQSARDVEEMRKTAISNNMGGVYNIEPSRWFNAMTQKINLLKDVEDSLSSGILTTAHSHYNEVLDHFLLLIGLCVGSILSIVVVTLSAIRKNFTRPIGILFETLEEISDSGRLSLKVPYQSEDMIGTVCERINVLLSTLHHNFSILNDHAEALSKGQLSGRIEETMTGDIGIFKDNLNHGTEQIDLLVKQLSQVMQEMAHGEFNDIDTECFPGDFLHAAEAASANIAATKGIFNEISQVAFSTAYGDFQQRIRAELPGEYNTLKTQFNAALDNIQTAIDEIVHIAQVQSQGDLSKTIQGSYMGALGAIKDAINLSISETVHTVSKIKQQSSALLSASKAMATSSSSISHSTEQQAAELEQISANASELTAAVTHNASNAESVRELAETAKGHASSGNSVMQVTVDAMQEVESSSKQIHSIIEIINGIAFQTNILALNVSVEAARAGEDGRGFSVVANEVRSLAQRSSESATQIGEVIQKSTEGIHAATTHVQKTSESLEAIQHGISELTHRVDEISTANHQQSSGIMQLTQSIQAMDSLTQSNASMVAESSESATALHASSQTLEQRIKHFILPSDVEAA